MARIRLALSIIIFIFIIGVVYRAYDLGHDSYWIDESYTVLASNNIGKYYYPRFDSGKDYWSGFPHFYLLFSIGELAGYGHVPMRMLSVIIGSALILLIFALVKEQYDEPTALLTSAMVALSYLEIAWSRQARSYIIAQFMFFLCIWLYIRLIKKPGLKNFIIMASCMILAIALHTSGLLLPVVMSAHYVITRNIRMIKRSMHSSITYIKKLKMSNASMIISLILLCVIFYITSRGLMNARIITNYSSQYLSFIFFNHYIFVFLAAIGFFAFKRHLKANTIYLISFALFFISSSFLVRDLNYRYLFIVLPVLYVFSSQAIIYLYNQFKGLSFRIMFSLIIVLLFFVSGFFILPKSSYALEYGTPQPSFKEAYDYLSSKANADDVLIVTQPAISELYYRKADYWLAIGYENVGVGLLYDNITGREYYTGIITIADSQVLNATFHDALRGEGYIVIDDMGLSRLPEDTRSLVQNASLERMYGEKFWSRVYIYSFGKIDK